MEDLIYRIFNRKIILYIRDTEYTIVAPTPELRYRAEIYKKRLMLEYKYELPRLEDYTKFLIALSFIDKDYEDKIKKLNDSIKKYKVELYKSIFKTSQEKKIKKMLGLAKTQLNNYYSKIEFYRKQSLEYFAEGIKNKYLLIHTTYYNKNLVFDINNLNIDLFTKMVEELNKQDITSEQFRNVARSDLWGSFWKSNKSNVFGVAPLQYTEDQRILCNFSRMYDSMFESPDFDDNIIGDSDREDGFLIFQHDKYKQEKNKNTSELDPKYSDVFKPAESEEDADRIYETNSPDSKRILRERARVIKSKETVKTLDFPDEQIDYLNSIKR